MVNPGHPSRGCQRCKARKIKCDQGTPCGGCKRHQQECLYQDSVFRSMNDSSAEKVRKRAGTRRLECDSTTLPTRRKSPNTLVTKSRSERSTQTPSPPKQTLCQSLSQFDDNYFLSILSRVLFPTTLSSDSTERTWPGYLALNKGHESLAYQCLQSLSRACTGQVARQPEFIVMAQLSYTSCLRRLHAQLEDPRTRCDDDILIPVAIFGAYEMLFLTVSDGWIRHTLGLAALFELRGSKAFTPGGTAIQVFRNARQSMILAALSARQETFLAREEWRTQPWIASHMARDIFERLLDIVVLIPGLNVRSLHSSDGEERADIHRDALDVLGQLVEWREEWESSPHGAELTLLLPPPHDASYPYKHLDPPVNYPSKYAATCDTLFQGAKIFVCNIALSTLPNGMQGAAGLVLTVVETALEICRSLPYFMTSKHSHRSKLDALWSLHLAWQVLRGSAGSQWVKERSCSREDNGSSAIEATVSTTPKEILGWLSGLIDDWSDAFGSLMVSPGRLGNAIRDS